MRALRAVLKIVLLLPVLAAAAGLVLGPTVLHPFLRRKMTAEQLRQAEQVFRQVGAAEEEFTVRAPDGVTLKGWKVRAARKDPSASPATGEVQQGNWVLLLHGRSHHRFAMLPHAEFLLAAGYNVVMMDARDHGDSGGAMSTYGYLEKGDEAAIADALLASERVKHLFALGESMGAAVALQSAAVAPRIEAVVAEGAFRDLREVTYDYAGLQESALLGKTVFRPAAEVARLVAEKQGGFSFAQVSPEKAVAQGRFPVLLICGLSDRKIPCRHSEAIVRAASGKHTLWQVPDTGHERAIETHQGEFRDRILKFFAEAAAEGPASRSRPVPSG